MELDSKKTQLPRGKKEKTKKATPKYDIMGQIDFPILPELEEIFFRMQYVPKIHVIWDGDKEISRCLYKNEVIKMLVEEFDYTVTIEANTKSKMHAAKKNLRIECQKECIYSSEKNRGNCMIKISPSIEHDKVTKQKLIKLIYFSRDLAELNKKNECLVRYVEELTGIKGKPTIYVRQELC